MVAAALALGAVGCTTHSASTAASAPQTQNGVPDAGVTSAAAPIAGGSAVSAAAPAATSGAAAPAPAASAAAAAASAAGTATTTVEGRLAFQADPTAGRSIIYTATVNVQVKTAAEVTLQADQAAQDAQDADGYVFSRDGQAATDDTPVPVPSGASPAPQGVAEADITIKVPPENYGSLVSRLEHLGSLLSIDEHSQDVTDQVVDSQARLSSLKASVERVRTLLAKATTIGEIVSVEGELTKRESDLEAMEGTLNVLKAQSALATLTLHLQSAPVKPVVVPPKPKPAPKPKHKIHGFLGGLKAGGRGFATVAVGVATVVGALLPFLGLALVLALLGWWGRRLWQRNRRGAGQVGHVGQATP